MDARDALDHIAKQAGIEIKFNPPWLWSGQNNSPVEVLSIDLDNAPFWSAMSDFCTAAHARVFENGPQGLMIGEDATPSTSHLGGVMITSGPYAVVATRITRNAQTDLATGQTSRFDNLLMSLYVDPNIRITSHSQAWLEIANDETGQSLLPDHNANADTVQMLGISYERFCIQQQAALKFPAHPGHSLALVRGGMLIETPDQVSTIQIDDITQSIGKLYTAGDYSLQITACHLAQSSGNLAFTASRKPRPAPPPDKPVAHTLKQLLSIPQPLPRTDWISNRLQGNAPTLINADGTQISAGGGGGGSDTRVDWTMNFNQSIPIQQPVKLVWRIPTKLRTDTVQFEFKDLPLPQE
jgi:hypothetical protein